MGCRIESRVAVMAILLLLGACSSTSSPSEGVRAPSSSGEPTSPAVSPSAPPDSGTDEPPAYSATVRRIGPELRDRMRFSHRGECPVPLEDLRYLRMKYVDFEASVRTGEMVVHEDHAVDVAEVFGRLYDEGWPIRRMRLVDAYRGDDDRSMAANNTSGYNCRRVTGGDAWSEHAYGAAIDINPVQNPYVQASGVLPPAGRRFARVDRTAGAHAQEGVVRSGDVVVRAFARIGWQWGGDWSGAKDYQHFSALGG